MNSFEFVKTKTDTSYAPVKYAVVEATVGAADTSTNLWLKCVGYGISTQEEYEKFVDPMELDRSILIGTLGEYSVVSLDTVEPYSSPRRIEIGDIRIG